MNSRNTNLAAFPTRYFTKMLQHLQESAIFQLDDPKYSCSKKRSNILEI